MKSCVVSGRDQLFLSPGQLLEIGRVLSYQKLQFSPEQQERILFMIEETATIVRATVDAPNLRDRNDTCILEPAAATRIDFIITGDDDLLSLKIFRTARIVSPGEFLAFR